MLSALDNDCTSTQWSSPRSSSADTLTDPVDDDSPQEGSSKADTPPGKVMRVNTAGQVEVVQRRKGEDEGLSLDLVRHTKSALGSSGKSGPFTRRTTLDLSSLSLSMSPPSLASFTLHVHYFH